MAAKTDRLQGIISENGARGDFFDGLYYNPNSVPLIPCRGIVAFPEVSIPLPIGRESTLKLVNDAADNKLSVVLTAQKDIDAEDPTMSQLYDIGVLARVHKVIELPDGSKTAFISTYHRCKILRITRRTPYIKTKIILLDEREVDYNDPKTLATFEEMARSYKKLLDLVGQEETHEIRYALSNIDDVAHAMNFICVHIDAPYEERQTLLEVDDPVVRCRMLIALIYRCIEKYELRNEILKAAQQEMSQVQREHFLQQQMKIIQNELNGDDDDIETLRNRADKVQWSERHQKFFEKELRKLERFNPTTPDYSIQYNFLDTLLNLPWDKTREEDFTLDKVQEVLDRDHYGLDKVKERIVEQMAVVKLRRDMKAPILCLYGPPGVGKTSLGKSVADALGREYCRVSLGGLHDEAEIRGHRRTYIGAMPGRIIDALTKCETNNPVFVLDEIDKIGKDFKGDPSTALLEVLDPEQNDKFHDNYLDVDYDLSKVLFLATANDLSTISRPLRDRMEIIEIPGYVVEEKVQIGMRHLVPKALENHGLKDADIAFTEDAIQEIIDGYTRESGVRLLEKKISKVLRKLATKVASGNNYPHLITKEMIPDLLGAREVFSDQYENNDSIGVVTGLAWTQVGGEILFIESSLSKGKGEKLTLTGNLGDVMKESAMLAMQYLKANADSLNIDPEAFSKYDVHIHVPEGAVPKDGPSAGITMVTSLVSSFTDRKVRERLAMTGEITLRGKVLPVGGIQEKILAAKRAGITDILLSTYNKKDIDEIKAAYLTGLRFHYVDNIRDVLDFALV